MKNIIYILLLLPLNLFSQHSDITFKNEYCEIILKDTLYLSGYITARVESPHKIDKYTSLKDLSIDKYPELPQVGVKVEADKVFKYKTELVRVKSTHTISNTEPKDLPNLFECASKEPIKEIIR